VRLFVNIMKHKKGGIGGFGMPCFASEVSLKLRREQEEKDRARKRQEEAERKREEIKKKKKALVAAVIASGYKVELGPEKDGKIMIIGKKGEK